MFTQLIASRPVRERSAGGLAGSILLHAALIAVALYATMRPAVVRERVPFTEVLYVAPKDPLPPAPPAVRNAAPPTGVFTIPSVPVLYVPQTSSMPLPSAPDFASFPMIRSPVGGITAPLPINGSTPLTVEQVEVPVSMATGSPLPRYPSILRSSGLDGTARFRFVVDTAGRVEMSTVEQLDASHVAFAEAVRATLPRMKFLPAQVGGHTVRQLVELPFVFRLTR